MSVVRKRSVSKSSESLLHAKRLVDSDLLLVHIAKALKPNLHTTIHTSRLLVSRHIRPLLSLHRQPQCATHRHHESRRAEHLPQPVRLQRLQALWGRRRCAHARRAWRHCDCCLLGNVHNVRHSTDCTTRVEGQVVAAAATGGTTVGNGTSNSWKVGRVSVCSQWC
jgi:hypothetical protein